MVPPKFVHINVRTRGPDNVGLIRFPLMGLRISGSRELLPGDVRTCTLIGAHSEPRPLWIRICTPTLPIIAFGCMCYHSEIVEFCQYNSCKILGFKVILFGILQKNFLNAHLTNENDSYIITITRTILANANQSYIILWR